MAKQASSSKNATAGIVLISLFCVFGWWCNKSCNEAKQEVVAEDAKPINQAKHNVRKYLLENLKDYSSYEAISWSDLLQDTDKTENTAGDYYIIYHKYRAKNSFGAYEITTQRFLFDKEYNVMVATTMQN